MVPCPPPILTPPPTAAAPTALALLARDLTNVRRQRLQRNNGNNTQAVHTDPDCAMAARLESCLDGEPLEQQEVYELRRLPGCFVDTNCLNPLQAERIRLRRIHRIMLITTKLAKTSNNGSRQEAKAVSHPRADRLRSQIAWLVHTHQQTVFEVEKALKSLKVMYSE